MPPKCSLYHIRSHRHIQSNAPTSKAHNRVDIILRLSIYGLSAGYSPPSNRSERQNVQKDQTRRPCPAYSFISSSGSTKSSSSSSSSSPSSSWLALAKSILLPRVRLPWMMLDVSISSMLSSSASSAVSVSTLFNCIKVGGARTFSGLLRNC